MVDHNWFLVTVLLWLLLCYHNYCINAQSQNAIGAHRIFQKTSFSCAGRPSGYYADIETGCQVYHMCDGLGRQFSYSCPNTTLFQQRMLICDHWYMVNCSKAESDYTANLLIGQRDKPFVNDEENNLRTPRPDLLDRPYAPDYSGESFRNQYQKSLSSVLNQIYDHTAQKMKEKVFQNNNQNQLGTGQQRWKIPPPSRIILPPAYEPQLIGESSTKSTTRTPYYSSTVTTTTRKPSTLRPTSTTRTQSTKFINVAALHNRHDEHLQLEHDDLGTSHSTRYNTSADFNSAEDRFAKSPQKASTQRKTTYNTNYNNAFTTAKPATTTRKTTLNPKIKVPSKIYEPPLLYPIYNSDDTTSTTTTTTARPAYRPSTASPFVTRLSATTTTTTTKAPTRPTTVVGKPFTRSSFSSSTKISTDQNNASQNRFDVTQLTKEIRTPAPAQGFKPPTPRPPMKNSSTFQNSTSTKPDRGSIKHEQPSKQLLPPLTDFITHDVATTQGPPIYYEWKVPSDGLEPPKLESPIGVDGREYPDTVIDYNSISTNNGFTTNTQFGIDQKRSNTTTSRKQESKPTIPSRTPTSRSVKETAQGGSEMKTKTPSTTRTSSQSSNPSDIFQIRKELSVPEYAFPLENAGRTGYLDTDVYNSFQLKIPERRADSDEHIHWYGENPKCPECHPSYVIPGTCEPCIRR
ncbi:jiangshi isoform 2-T8 [Cochliomyia hominivorax]